MDEEHLENSLYEVNLVKNVLGMDIEHFHRHKSFAVKGLKKFGGTFAYRLGILLEIANFTESVKILNIWSPICTEHDLLYRIHKAKEDAEETTA